MRVLVDASVFLKLLLDEPGADKAQEILEAIEASSILACFGTILRFMFSALSCSFSPWFNSARWRGM